MHSVRDFQSGKMSVRFEELVRTVLTLIAFGGRLFLKFYEKSLIDQVTSSLEILYYCSPNNKYDRVCEFPNNKMSYDSTNWVSADLELLGLSNYYLPAVQLFSQSFQGGGSWLIEFIRSFSDRHHALDNLLPTIRIKNFSWWSAESWHGWSCRMAANQIVRYEMWWAAPSPCHVPLSSYSFGRLSS